MAKIVVVAQVKDLAKWEEGFRTHGDLFRSQSITKPITFGTTEGNAVAVCFEPDDMAASIQALASPATKEAMLFDGILLDTVKVFVLDQEFKV